MSVSGTLRVATWNLNVWTSGSRKAEKAALLAGVGFDIALLQECDEATYAYLIAEGLAAGGHFHGLADGGITPADPRRAHGAAILAGPAVRLDRAETVAALVQPERGVCATGHLADGDVRLLAWHSPHAVGEGADRMAKKMGAYRAILDWFTQQPGPLVAGVDANTPWHDPLHRDDVERRQDDPWFEDSRFYGSHKAHQLDDAWVTYLEHSPDVRERILRLRPDGPLAVSHNRGARGTTTPCRYDLLLVSPDTQVANMVYEYADAVGAGSDHALVWADHAPFGPRAVGRSRRTPANLRTARSDECLPGDAVDASALSFVCLHGRPARRRQEPTGLVSR